MLGKSLGPDTQRCRCALKRRSRLRCNMQIPASVVRLGVCHLKERQGAGKLGLFMWEGPGTAGGEVTDAVMEPTDEPRSAIN